MLQCETKLQIADHLTKIMESQAWADYIETGKITVKPAKYNRAEARKVREQEREKEIQRRKQLGLTTERINIVTEWVSKMLGCSFTLTDRDVEPISFEDQEFTGEGQEQCEEFR